MTKAEVAQLVDAIKRLETGQNELGVALLRRMVVEAGAQPPPLVVIAAKGATRETGRRR